MNTHPNGIEVINNENAQQYEVRMGEHIAVLVYKRAGKHITYIHTGVPAAMKGQGIASKLARTALEDARKEHLSVTPQCPFVASYIREHTEYLPLLSQAEQTRVMQE